MGQQQLLLLMLAVVVVGLATAVGIDALLENRRKAEEDVIVYNLVRLATSAQSWKLTPTAMGGGEDALGFTGVERNFSRLGWSTVPRGITAWDPVRNRNTTMPTECYRPNLHTMYCPVPQWSGGNTTDGELFLYVVGNLMGHTGDTWNSNDMNIIAYAVVHGTEADDIETVIYR